MGSRVGSMSVRRLLRNEQGSTLIMVASMMVLFLGFAALAVDVGLGYNERRQAQSAADAGVMAGALESYANEDDIIREAREYVEKNVVTTYTTAEWDTMWAACVDSGKTDFGLNFTPLTDASGVTYDCISADGEGYVRVRVPDQEYDTPFGAIFGASGFDTFAFAIARLQPIDTSDVLPFGLLSGAGPGDTCVRTGSNGPSVPPCDGPSSGNFYMINSPTFGNDDLGTTRQCTGGVNARFALNLALGIDHFVSLWSAGEDLEQDVCGADPFINQLNPRTGNGSSLFAGLVSNQTFGSFNRPSRLQSYPAGYPTRTIANGNNPADYHTLDNKPLWDFLLPGAGAVHASCDPLNANFVAGGAAARTQMNQCFTDYPGTGQIFSLDLQYSPRFGSIPRFLEAAWPAGTSEWRTIVDFEPVFLDGLWMNCSAGACGIEFFPGHGSGLICDPAGPGCKNIGPSGIEQMTGFVFDKDMLPTEIRNGFGPSGLLFGSEPTLWR